MKIIYGNSPITFGDSLVITVVSMLTVFLVLILISFILSLLKYLPSEKKVTENKKVTVKPLADTFSVSSENSISEGKKIGPEDIKDEKMLAAVAAAVIDAAGEIDNAYIKVRSIRKVNQ
jgi:putative uncharacterized protein (fragment)